MRLSGELLQQASKSQPASEFLIPEQWHLDRTECLNELGLTGRAAVFVSIELRLRQLRTLKGCFDLTVSSLGLQSAVAGNADADDNGELPERGEPRRPGMRGGGRVARVQGLAVVSLDASLNDLSAIDGLTGFSSLLRLNLAINQIAKIANLDSLTTLRELTLANNRLARIEGLASLVHLRLLDLSNNDIELIENLDALTSLVELRLDGNALAHLDNLAQLTALRVLSASGNRLADAQHLTFIPSLERVLLADNAIAELDPLAQTLRSLPRLTEACFSGNPIEQHRHYRLRLLESDNMRVLDAFAVTPLFRQQAALHASDAALGDVVALTTGAYLEKIDSVRRAKETKLASLRDQQIDVSTRYDSLASRLETELNVLTSHLHSVLRARRAELDVEQVRDVLRASEAARWHAIAHALEHNTAAWHAELRRVAEGMTHDSKLAALAMKSPAVWRALKEQELALRQADDVERTRADARLRLAVQEAEAKLQREREAATADLMQPIDDRMARALDSWHVRPSADANTEAEDTFASASPPRAGAAGRSPRRPAPASNSLHPAGRGAQAGKGSGATPRTDPRSRSRSGFSGSVSGNDDASYASFDAASSCVSAERSPISSISRDVDRARSRSDAKASPAPAKSRSRLCIVQ